MTIYSPEIIQTALLTQYRQVRQQTLDICRPLKLEDYVVQPVTDVSPPKWHLGHVTWFFENFILGPHQEGYALFDPTLNYYFNSYYESQGPRILRSRRGNMTRPSLEVVLDYRKYVDRHVEKWINSFREQNIPTIMGNYDQGVGNSSDDCGCAYKTAAGTVGETVNRLV